MKSLLGADTQVQYETFAKFLICFKMFAFDRVSFNIILIMNIIHRLNTYSLNLFCRDVYNVLSKAFERTLPNESFRSAEYRAIVVEIIAYIHKAFLKTN